MEKNEGENFEELRGKMEALIKDLKRVDKESRVDGHYREGKVTGVLNTYNMH